MDGFLMSNITIMVPIYCGSPLFATRLLMVENGTIYVYNLSILVN